MYISVSIHAFPKCTLVPKCTLIKSTCSIHTGDSSWLDSTFKTAPRRSRFFRMCECRDDCYHSNRANQSNIPQACGTFTDPPITSDPKSTVVANHFFFFFFETLPVRSIRFECVCNPGGWLQWRAPNCCGPRIINHPPLCTGHAEKEKTIALHTFCSVP